MSESFGLDDEVVSGSGASFDFGMDDETVDGGGSQAGFFGNALRGAGERAFTLGGNLMQFAGNLIEGGEQYLTDLTGINPALVEGPNGLEFTMHADPAATDTGLNRGGELIGGVKMGYEPRYTWEQLKADPSLRNLAGFVGEQGVQSVPDMAAVLVPGGMVPYVGSRTQEIAEARTGNDGRVVENGQVAGSDLAAAAPAAVASALLERVGAKGVTQVGGVATASGLGKAVATAAAKEGATEFAQENIEYAGESVGTKAGYDVMTGLDRGAAGLVAGAGLGGTVRTATGTAELAVNKLKKPIPTNDPNGMSLDEAVGDDIPTLTDAVYPSRNLLPAPDQTLYGTPDGQIIDGVEYQNLDLERGNAQREAEMERLQDESLGYPGGPGMYNPVQPRTNLVAGPEDGDQEQANPLDDVAHEAATSPLNDLPEPTEAQKEAGNYRKGHLKVQGLDISIENPAGSKRTGTAKDGTEWETEMAHHYGYVKRTTGADGDQVDVFLGGNPESDKVFVVDQVNDDGEFDEHKVLIGFDSLEDADAGYHSNYSEGWNGRGAITEITMPEFKDWLKNGDTKKPLAYAKPEPAPAAEPAPAPEPTVEELRQRLDNLQKQALLSGWKPEMIRERKRLGAAIYQAETGVAPAEEAVESSQADEPASVLPRVHPKRRLNESHEGNRDIRIERLQKEGLDILSNAFFGEADGAAGDAKRRNQGSDGYLYGYRRVGFSSGPDDYAVVRQAAPEGFILGDSVQRLEVGQVWQNPAGQQWRVSETDQKGFWGTFQVVGEDGKSGKRTTTINGMRDSVLLGRESGKSSPAESKPDAEKVKWFGNQKKAQEYIDRKKLGGTHEVVPAGNKRFEIRRKATDKDSLTVQEFPYPEAADGMAERIRDEIDRDVLGKVVAEASSSAAPGTRKNGGAEKAAASRLEKLLDVMPAKLKPQAQSARNHIKSVVGELKRPSTTSSIVELLETASDRFTRAGHEPFARVVDEVVESLQKAGRGEVEPEAPPTKKASQKKNQTKWADDLGIAVGDRVVFEKDHFYAKGTMEIEGIYKNDVGLVDPGTKSGTTLTARQLRQAIEGGIARVEKAGGKGDAQDSVGGSQGSVFADATTFDEYAADDNGRRVYANKDQNAPEPVDKPAEAADDRFAGNKLFTSDKVAAARARMKSKLGQLNSGIDPEMLIDGMTIAGAYIESGVRDFAQYAKTMVEDLGGGVKPYLLSFWEGARNYPGLDTKGMTGAEESRRQFDALITPEQAKEVAPAAIGQLAEKPKQRTKKTGARGDMVLTQDWGVEQIDGYGDDVRETGNETKDAFLKETRNYLNAVADALRAFGFEPHLDSKGKPEKPVSVNESGVATSGDVSLVMRNEENGNNVYVTIGGTSLLGVVPSTPSGIAVMYRIGATSDRYAARAGNRWAPVDLSANDLAALINSGAETTSRSQAVTNANAPETQQLPERNPGANPADAAPGDRDSQPVDAGLAETGAGTDRVEPVPGSPAGAGSRRAQSVERAGQQSSGTPRNRGDVRPEPKPADSVDPATAETSTKPELDPAADFDLQAEDIGKGGLTKKYRDNIAAIRILKAMASENRQATPEERKQIARYVGWGALKGVFDKENKQWAKEFAELKDLLTDAEYKAARASTRNAHYTSKTVVTGIYDAIGRLGFTSGRVLEPSAGTGNFFGMMPAAMRKKSQLHGVELDPLTSQIAAALYPSAKIAQSTGFQDFDIPAEYFDLAIGNPPFGEEPIVDDARSPYSGASIHNYFFAKSIDKLRPGGLLAMVVSHNFLDAKNDATRRWIAERADLVSAVRLPRTAFKENAGTDVVTDILVFKKRESGAQPGSDAWVKSAQQPLTNPKTGEEFTLGVNQYFLDNPGAVLGTPTAGGSMYRAGEYTVEPSGDLADQLKGWVDSLPAGMFRPIERTHEAEAADVVVPDGVKVGSFFVDEKGNVQLRGPDAMGNRTATEWAPPSARAGERMKGMIGLRDALRTQMRLEKSQDATEAQIEAHRRELNRLYDEFQGKYGYLNDPTNRRIFLDDTESALLLALEFDYDKGVSKAVAEREDIEARPPSAVKADIFNRRVMFPPADNIKVSSAQDALIASLNYKGRLDLDYMAGLYSKDQSEIIGELGDLVFNDPLKGMVTADEYLSGDVKTKLAEAEAAAIDKPEFKRNVTALKKVIPADKRPSEIHAALGAIFVPPEIYAEFAKEITGATHAIHYVRATGQWIVEPKETPNASLNVGKWGIGKMPAAAILAKTMAGQGVVVTQVVRNGDGSTTTLVLEKETEAAREKQAAIKAEWQRWLWSDPDRADRIATIYNEKMNRTVVRKYDGSHMTFPGMSPAIQLLPHQKNGVWRGLQSRQLLLDHVVGAGKTFEVVALFMEMRRLGIARKPLIAVPNHLTLQWRSEFSRLYPAANVLAATPDDFSKGNREKFFSKIITGDWDAVIVGHSSLKKIALPADTEKAVLEEQITELSEAIEETKRARGDRNIIRDMEGIKARLEARMKQRLQALGDRDKVVTFDELGVDALAVDELHEFKNLFYNSTMERVPGMGNPAGSDKAFDLFVKLQWMFNTFGDQAPVFGATGTPVSNSLVEMFNMQRFLQYPTLKREGLHVFDAWAKQFGSVESLYEVSPSGTGYRQSSRFAKFKNLPALMNHYLTFADVVTLDDLKAQEIARGKTFPVPKVATGRPINVVAKRSPLVSGFMGVPKLSVEDGAVQFGFNVAGNDRVTIEQSKDGEHWDFKVLRPIDGADGERVISSGRAKTEEDARLSLVEAALSPQIVVDPESILGKFGRLRELNKATKGKVNALSLTGQANKAGLDYRLIDPSAPDFAGSKINLAVDRMVATYKKWSADKGAQLVFCDLSVPLSARSGFGSKERRIYVRNEDGGIAHKRGTLHTVEGHEELPFFLVKEGKEKTFAIYDAATGIRIHSGLPSKATGMEWATQLLGNDAKRQRWIDARDEIGDIEQEAIDDYNNANEIDTEESEAISLADIAGSSGAQGFSVYDDIKAKLIAKGIPEREIAFIHDFGTPAAKEKLFKAVNNGTIRFLLGSTPKMGAGTNVQKRLVGLHHIDAPWRPSDLEQREGRIIRRGNMLYERDPDGFEVEIFRYATEQTYDTRRWQILEHKARGIEQLRNYDGTLNEIDDIEGEAANAADMKAAASGDPLILEETQLRNEVRRLETLQASHADETQTLSRRARERLRVAQETGPKDLKRLQDLLTAAEKHPVKKDEFAGVEVDGKKFKDREDAVKAIKRAIDGVFKDAMEIHGGKSATFTYRGVEFSLDGVGGYIELGSPTGTMDTFAPHKQAPPSAAGFLTRFANYINRLQAHVDEKAAEIERAKAEAVQFREEAAKPFPFANDLAEAREAHKKVQRRLIAKGPDIPASEKAMLDEALKAQKAALRDKGYGEALDEFLGGDSAKFQPSTGKPATGTTASKVERWIAPVVASWGDLAPKVRVVQSLSDMPTDLIDAAGQVLETGEFKAVLMSNTVYIVADAVENRVDALKSLAHETRAHWGMQIKADSEYQAAIERINWASRNNKYLGRLREQVLAELKPAQQTDERIAEEVLAKVAEDMETGRPVSEFVQRLANRVFNAIRSALRRFGFAVPWSTTELKALVLEHDMLLRSNEQRKPPKDQGIDTPFFQPDGSTRESPEVIGKRFDDVLKQGGENLMQKARDWLASASVVDASKRGALMALTLRQLADVGRRILPQIAQYDGVVKRIQTERNIMAERAATIAEDWQKWAAKNRKAADRLHVLMHKATIEQVDPSESFVSMKEHLEARAKVITEQLRSISGQRMGSTKKLKPSDDGGRGAQLKRQLFEELKQLRSQIKAEPERERAHKRLKPQWDAMPPEAKAMYTRVRDEYKARHDKFKRILVARIMKAEMSEKARKEMLARMRYEFETQELTGPYFPLTRFGRYWLESADENGERVFLTFESEAEQSRVAKNLEKAGYPVTTGHMLDNSREASGASLGFINDLVRLVEDSDLNDDKAAGVMDDIYQLYLQNLPDRSMRKNFIHRQGVKGYSENAIRSYAENMMKGAYQLARLNHVDSLSELMDSMKKEAKLGDNKKARLYNEMVARHEWVMNPTHSSWAQSLTSLGFVYMLGASPAAAAINMAQVPAVAVPVLGSKFGFAKTAAALSKAAIQFSWKSGRINPKRMTEGEQLAMQEWIDIGVVDQTRSHDLAGLAEGGGYKYSAGREKAMRAVSFLFHRAEQFNREITALAAYRMGIEKGWPHGQAVKVAADLTWDAHFDYSNANRARFMQKDWQKVAFQFKNYSQHMTYYMARNLWQIMKGATPKERREAFKQLGGTLGVTALMGGTSALPVLWAVYAAMNAALDDEDEPFDAETEFRVWLAEMIGKDAASKVLFGLGGAGLSGRISLDGLWIRDPNRDLEGTDAWAHYATQAAGPVLGGIGMNAVRATDDFAEGDWWAGTEKILPKAIKDVMKAVRFYNEGVTNSAGVEIVSRDDLKLTGVLLQGMGLADSGAMQQYAENASIKNYETRIRTRRSQLMTRYYMAVTDGDRDELREVSAEIARFNQKNWGARISQATLRRSMKARRRSARESENGIRLSRSMRYLRDELDYVD